MLTLLLNNCLSPHTKKPREEGRMLLRKRLQRWWTETCVASGPTAECCGTWARLWHFSATWNFVVQLPDLSQVCTESICWLFGTTTLVALCSWKRVSLCSTGWIGTHVWSPDWLKICISPSTQPPKCWACRFQGVSLPQNSLFPSE